MGGYMSQDLVRQLIVGLLAILMLPGFVEAKGGRGGRSRGGIKIHTTTTATGASYQPGQVQVPGQVINPSGSAPTPNTRPELGFFNDWSSKKSEPATEKKIDSETSRASFEAAQAKQNAAKMKVGGADSERQNLKPGTEQLAALDAKAGQSRGAECRYGFVLQAGSCVELVLPANSRMNIHGNGWNCEFGYQSTGSACSKIQVPANATLNFRGDDWKCLKGYQRSGEQCI